jgi:hypothetical protein
MTIAVMRDLRVMFGPARDQGDRPTCLAFAASDSHAALRDGWTPLSCEFAFYHSQRRSGRSPHVGATLSAMLDALRENGQPVESEWPYLAAVPNDLNAWAPPESIDAVYRRAGERRGKDFDEIIELLDDGHPALVLMMLSDAFYVPNARGVVVAPIGEGPDPQRRHAVVAVAHGIVANERAVLARNSWGPDWGISGYAWLSETFLTPRLFRVALLTENIDVFAHRTAA